jgi:hypothetical protein
MGNKSLTPTPSEPLQKEQHSANSKLPRMSSQPEEMPK